MSKKKYIRHPLRHHAYPLSFSERVWWSAVSDLGSRMIAVLAGGVAVVVGMLRLTGGVSTSSTSQAFPVWFSPVMLILGALYLGAAGYSVWVDGYRRMFDPTMALKYVDLFFKEMKEERSIAAKATLRARTDGWAVPESLTDIDDVLDFFDDLGFLVRGHQMSLPIVHQYFFHWLRLYGQACDPYVKATRKIESTQWNHLEDLLMRLSEMEAEIRKVEIDAVRLSENELDDELRDEASLGAPESM